MNSLEEKMEELGFSHAHMVSLLTMIGDTKRASLQLEVSEQDIRKYVKKYNIYLVKKNSKSYYPGKESMIK